MADIYSDDFFSTEQSDMENLFSSGDAAEEEKRDDEEEKTEEKEEENASEVKVANIDSQPDPQPKIPTLEELADSDFINNRQLAAKSIVEYLHQAGSNKDALHSVISVMCKLLEDEDLSVRSELMEHIPSIALFCKQRSEDLGVVIRQQIVPYTVKLITDVQLQIRKIGHTTLLVLLENKIIDNSHLTEWICPLVAQLAASENAPEDVSVMCKMIPYVGKEITEKFFLEPFLSLCCDRSASSREVCMLHFGNLSKILGRETTESILLPVYLDLCQEETAVGTKMIHQKIQCVEIAVDLATVVSPTTRHEVLSCVYIDFLNDSSRGVSFAAHMSLGRFISTFADPSKTGLCYRDGVWVDIPFEDDYTEDQQNNVNYFEHVSPQVTPSAMFLDEVSLSKLHVLHNRTHKYIILKNLEKYLISEKVNDENSNVNSIVTDAQNTLNCEKKSNSSLLVTFDRKDEHQRLHVDNDNLFNNFQFWRTPLPEVELDIDIEECKSTNISVKAKIDNEEDKSQTQELNVRISTNETSKETVNTLSRTNLRTDIDAEIYEVEEPMSVDHKTLAVSGRKARRKKTEANCRKTIYDQNVVPPKLLLEYAEFLPVDDDLRISCAYYFPSVAYTLGRKYWPCIRGTFHWLARNITQNVRKSVASSLHELAIILGRDITNKDLFPVFCEMLDDKKLRAIVLKHVSQFLKHLRPIDRKPFLQSLKYLCVSEEERDWRYRLTVAEQLVPCIELYTAGEALHFFSVALTLLEDKVCAVRKSAVELLAISLSSIIQDPKSSEFLKASLIALNEKYRKSNKWLWRQMYVYICQELAVRKSLPTELYVDEIVPNLFSLAWDTVPNVRLAVARCISLTLLPLGFLPSIQRKHGELLLQVIFSLQSDADDDVRHFARLSSAVFNDSKYFILDTETFPDV